MEINVDPRTTSRRTFLSVAAGTPLVAALAACGSSGPEKASATGATSKGSASYWYLSGPPGEPVRNATVKRFNQANPNTTIKPTSFANDAYKTKIKTAIGSGRAPTIIWGWGGGTLRSYVQAGQVEDLTSWFGDNSAVKNRLFPSSFGAATINGKIYAMPAETVQPIVLYYSKKQFEKIGAEPPQSWNEIMALVPRFVSKGIAPFSLAGASRWTNMMWLEFLFDRTGGPEVFQAVFDGEKNAWSNPVAISALTKAQDLVRAKGFIKGFSSVTADANADQALLYTGRTAMMLHGSWSYGIQKDKAKKFVSSGDLAYMNFPPVEGGTGDPSNTVGNPGQYLSISSKATDEQKDIAKKFFASAVLSDAENKEWVDTGGVPIVNGTQPLLAASPDAAFLKFVYDISSQAKVFAQSWDQALSPTAAESLLDNIAKLFQLSISPQQFATNMNAVIGT
jgi:raffinose/stachyose/melibiose transport system substrate-binding protein